MDRAPSLELDPDRSTRLAPVRVMVVDDSAIVRTVFANIIRREPDLELTATAATAEEGLALLSIRPVDIVLLDLEMPGMGGLDALPRMLAAVPGLQILVVSSLTRAGAEPTLKALALGAADTLAKPTSGKFDDEYRLRLVTRLRALGRLTGRQGPIPSQPPRPAVVTRRPGAKRPQVLAIGASTGGIHALGHFLGALPAMIGLPILVTQHLPASFMEAFARQLVTASGREAVVAQDGEALIADRILIAPGDAHLTVVRQGKRLVVRHDRAPAASGCLPSVDPMFASLAAACDGEVLGIVLSGMGRDGADGAARIVEAGGTILAQDEASSAVWGMPGAVAKAGLAAAILPPVQLALRIGARPALAT